MNYENIKIKIEKDDALPDNPASNLIVKLDALEKDVAFLVKLGQLQDIKLKEAQDEVKKAHEKICELDKIVLKISQQNVRDASRGKYQIYVTNMAPGTTTLELTDHFNKYGKVVEAVILRQNLRSQCGYVEFESTEAVNVILDSGLSHYVKGRNLIVKKSLGPRVPVYEDKENFYSHDRKPLKSYQNKRYFPY
ncbi:CLUMA_CG016364, isoform A [Clunio marinus]|uniref:CLUMA_CG016364, isoform A n=1 Tax=Clunio marinus TaxID=568069 RepID=A0A1J1ITM1_9DIPT|nr:CLUMA_CG016364, isoform A [Clunio marinus]